MRYIGRNQYEERRPTVRVVVDVDAHCGNPGSPLEFDAHISEISASGMRLRTGDQRLAVGMAVDISFNPDAGARSNHMLFHVRARVVRIVCADESRLEYGLRVLDEDGSKDALRRAVLKISLSRAGKP